MFTPQLVANALRAAANVFDPQNNAVNAPGGYVTPATMNAPQAVIQPQPSSGASGPPATVSAEELTGLIMPHIGNEAIKAALGVAMRNMGVNGLPEARPDQYPALYASFQSVLTAHGVGTGAPAAQVLSASII